MSKTLKGRFETRREAEMTVERLVQEHDIDRAAILVAAEGDDNTAGVETAGADAKAGDPSEERRDDAALGCAILVVVDLEDDALIAKVLASFREFDAEPVG